MRTPGQLVVVALAVAVAIVCAACHPATPEQRAASLCQDLLHLGTTVDLLARTPQDATVGQVRAGLEKLDPTFDAVAGSALVPDALQGQLAEARTAYGEAIVDVGDDDPATEVAADVADARRRLDAAYTAIVGGLGCGASASVAKP